MLGVSFRKGILVLLFVWTLVFFIFIGSLPTFHQPRNACATQEPPIKKAFPKELSFVVLNWKRTDCIRTIIQHAQKYHSFITEIVIGNNNPNYTLKPQDFFSPLIPIRVFNFPQNRFFYARYEACLLAEGLYCYLQDDDWQNNHLRGLYANFLRFPDLLHTDTNAFVHYLSWAWTFYDADINMHTGFSWLGTGAIASKKSVKTFLEEQAILIAREDLPLADMYFSTWFNEVPYQLENELTELESRFGFSSEPGGIKRNKIHITKGVRTLYDQLKRNTTIHFKKEELVPVEERYTKSPCYADDCLFMTSLHSFPNPRQFIYEQALDLEMIERRKKDNYEYERFISHAYHHAVDNNFDTSFISQDPMQEGDFFGLDLMEASAKEYVYLRVGHGYQHELSLDVSHDGVSWTNESCIWEVDSKEQDYSLYHRYIVSSGCVCEFRFIRFRALTNYTNTIQLYDISFVDNREVWQIVGPDGVVVPTSSGCQQEKQQVDELPVPINIYPQYLREIGNGDLPVTLILLNWRRTRNFPQIFEHLANFPFINEYIIWNNNNEMTLEQSKLFPKGAPPGVNVRVINSPQNLHDYAKYLSCSMATNDYCYFQDDDWLNVHLRSQYTNFLRYPHLFHSMTIPIIYLEHRRWNIFDENLGMHAGFSWLGVGSFTSKERVQRFLWQLSNFDLTQDELLQADILFSYLNNDYPVELSTTASALDQTDAWSTGVDQWGIVYKRLQLASLKVYNLLKSGDPKSVIPKKLPSPPYEERDVRAPCHRDNCLFITNSYPFPYPDKVPFDPAKSIKDQESVYNALDWPSNWFWNENSYERAVDGNPYTAWSSYQVVKGGDYFGIDLLQNKVYSKFTIVLDSDITKYEVGVSSYSTRWTQVTYKVEALHYMATPLRSYTIILDYNKPFRFVYLYVRASADEILSVYEIAPGEYPGTFGPFSPNKVQNPSFEDVAADPGPNLWSVQHPAQVDFETLQRDNIFAASGTQSLVFSSKGGASLYSARQSIDLKQNAPKMVVVSAYSKAENVINMEYPGSGYSLVVDLKFMDGSTQYDAQTSVFNPGSHTWQAKVIAIKAERSIKTVTIHLIFRNHKGTVYFDDISLQEEL